MAYKKFNKDTQEFQMFQEFWSIFKNFGQVENTEEYWNDFVNNARRFAEKYGDYGKQLMLVTLEEFERKSKIIV